MSLGHGASIVRDGLVLHLDAAGVKSYPGSGTTWTDLSGNGNDGTLVNGVGYSSDNKGALTFDGTNDYITIPNSSSVQLSNNSPFSISYFINLNRVDGTYMAPIMKGGFTSSYGHLIGSTNYFLVYTDNDSSNELFIQNMLNDYVNTWVNITQTYDGDKIYVYRNGVLYATSGTGRTLTTNTSTLYIGINGGSNYFLDGDISNMMLYNRELTADEIKQNFEATRGRYGI